MSISIIGTGNMARGIGTRLVAGGHTPLLFGNDRDKTALLAQALGTGVAGDYEEAVASDVIVLATPYDASLATAKELGSRLDGKVLIDISNPLNASFDGLATEPGTSAAEQIAKAAPGARVVKAFNTTFAGTLVNGAVNGETLDVFLAGHDEQAKAEVASLVEARGLGTAWKLVRS